MKKTVTPIPQPKPPIRVILDLSEGEASLIRLFASYYATTATAAAAQRLVDALAPFAGRHEYPYTDYFKEE